MLYNPEKIPDGVSPLTYYKELNKVKEFKLVSAPGSNLDEGKVMLYILLMYDKESPYRKKFPDDAIKRKIAIAHDIGWKTENGGEFDIDVNDILRGKNKIVNQKIIQYIRLHRSYAYSFQVSVEASYAHLMLEVQNGNTKNLDKLKELRDELEKNLLEMLNQDGNAILKDDMLKHFEEERIGLRPEDYAQRQREGKAHPKPRKTAVKREEV